MKIRCPYVLDQESNNYLKTFCWFLLGGEIHPIRKEYKTAITQVTEIQKVATTQPLVAEIFSECGRFFKVYCYIVCGKFTSAEKKAKQNYYIGFPQRRNAHIKSLLCYLPSLFVFVVFGYYKFCRKSRTFAENFPISIWRLRED